MIYFGYSANTPADPRIAEAFLHASPDCPGNPNSRHPVGQVAAKVLADTWTHIAVLPRILPEGLIFISGATEANNLVLLGSTAARHHVDRHIISTALEHPSISATLNYLQEVGYETDLPSILPSGCTDLNTPSSLLRKDTYLVSLSAVDSELGTLQLLAEAAMLIRHFPDCHFHVDATQAIGEALVDFSVADSMSFTSHKFYDPAGSGALYKKRGIPLYPQLHGGESDSPYRNDTPVPAETRALGTVLELAFTEETVRYDLVAAHNVYLHAALKGKAKVAVNSPTTAVPHILNLSTAGPRGVTVQAVLALSDICISVRSVCSTDVLPSRTVSIVNRSRKNMLISFRLNLSHLTTREELNALLETLAPLLHRPLARKDHHDTRTSVLSNCRAQHHQKV